MAGKPLSNHEGRCDVRRVTDSCRHRFVLGGGADFQVVCVFLCFKIFIKGSTHLQSRKIVRGIPNSKADPGDKEQNSSLRVSCESKGTTEGFVLKQ